MGRGVWAESQMILLCNVAQVVEHHARLYPGSLPVWVEGQDMVQVFGHIQHHGHITALPSRAGATAARQHWRSIAPRRRHGRDDVIDIPRQHYANRHLAIIQPSVA